MVDPIMAGMVPNLTSNTNSVQNNTTKVSTPESKSQPEASTAQAEKTNTFAQAQSTAAAVTRGDESSKSDQQQSGLGNAFQKGNQVDLFA